MSSILLGFFYLTFLSFRVVCFTAFNCINIKLVTSTCLLSQVAFLFFFFLMVTLAVYLSWLLYSQIYRNYESIHKELIPISLSLQCVVQYPCAKEHKSKYSVWNFKLYSVCFRKEKWDNLDFINYITLN